MADKEIRISVIVDSDGAVKSLKELDQGTERAGDTAKRSSEGFSKLQASIVTINQAVSLARSVFSGFQSIASTLFDTLNQATVIEGLSRSFDNLQTSIGVLGDQKIASLQNATKGLIADFDLMQQANQAVLLGVDKGTGEFEELAGAALKLGAATGRTATEALGDLITGLGRASPLILDNLGITVKAAEAQQLYADKLGKAVKDLTEAEKAEAFRAVAIDKIRQKSLELAEVQETAGTAAQRLETSLENLFADVATGISENEDLRDAINDLAKVISETDFTPLIEGLGDIIALAATAAAEIAKLGAAVAKHFSFTEAQEASEVMEEFGETARNAAQKLVFGFRTLEPTKENVLLLSNSIGDLQNEMLKNGQTTGRYREAYDKLKKAFNEFKKPTLEAAKAIKTVRVEMGGGANGAGGASVGEEAEKIAKQIDALKNSFKSVSGFDGAPGVTATLQGLYDAVQAGVLSSNDAQSAFENYVNSLKDSPSALDDVADSMGLIKKNTDDAKESAESFRDALNGIDFSAALGESFNSAFGSGGDLFSGLLTGNGGIGGAFGQLFDEDGLLGLLGLGGANAGIYGAAIAAIFSGISSAFDITNTEEFKKLSDDEKAQAFQNAFKAGAGSTFGIDPDSGFAKFGDQIDEFLGSINAGKNFQLDPIKQIFGNLSSLGLFGSNDPGTNERQAIDDFFRELFDGERLSLVIAGELQDVTDLTVSEYNGFFDTLNTATEEGLNQFRGFEGIGLALNEILGLEAVGDEQIGAILGNNLETLNNLQIFLGKAKISADQLGEALEEAFLNGDITAKQFLTSSAQIENIYTQGIPDGVGLTQKAFENLLESAGQGRLALDALGDLGVEAIEKGITSLEDLRQDLLDSGADADEVAKLFEAIAQSGITSLEELQNISLEKVAQIVQILEDSGIDLGLGDAQAELDDIQEKLNNLPERVRTTVEIDVQTRARDQGAEQVIESGALGEGLRNA